MLGKPGACYQRGCRQRRRSFMKTKRIPERKMRGGQAPVIPWYQTPQDVLDTLGELQARYDARAWNNQPREAEEQSLKHLAHASQSRGTNKGVSEWLQERVSIEAIK